MERNRFLRRFGFAWANDSIDYRASHVHDPSGKINVAPFQTEQLALPQASGCCKQDQGPFAKAKTLQQRSDFHWREQRGRGSSLGTLTNKAVWVAVKQFIPAGVVEENRHQVSDLRAAALGQRQTAKPGLDFHRSDLEKLIFSPMGNNPSLQIGMIGPFSRITAPSIVARQFALLEMIAELSDSHCVRTYSPIARIDFRDEANDCAAGSIFRGILLHRSDNSLTVDSSAFRTLFRPPKLPDIRTLFANLSDQTSTLHFVLLHRGCSAEGIVAPQRRQILDKCLGKTQVVPWRLGRQIIALQRQKRCPEGQRQLEIRVWRNYERQARRQQPARGSLSSGVSGELIRWQVFDAM